MRSATGSPRRRPQREHVRAQLLDAALDVFSREGYAAASLQQIATAAGFTKGAVYSNFGSKQDLFLALVDDRFAVQLNSVLSELHPRTREWNVIVREACALLARHIIDNAAVHGLMVEFALQASRDLDVARVHTVHRASQERQVVRALRERAEVIGVAVPESIDRVASTLLPLSCGLALEHLVNPARTTEAVMSEILADAVLGAHACNSPAAAAAPPSHAS